MNSSKIGSFDGKNHNESYFINRNQYVCRGGVMKIQGISFLQ